ncbi:MAG: hypothetical protein AB1705_26205 [Verrucomicrobiota bacterium]
MTPPTLQQAAEFARQQKVTAETTCKTAVRASRLRQDEADHAIGCWAEIVRLMDRAVMLEEVSREMRGELDLPEPLVRRVPTVKQDFTCPACGHEQTFNAAPGVRVMCWQCNAKFEIAVKA